MIKALTPYYVTIPFLAPISGLVCDYFIVNFYVWAGEKTSVPTEPTYSITIKNVETSSGDTEINIANWISDFIEFTPQTFTGTQLVNGNNQYWVQWETLYKTTDEDDLITPTNTTTQLFLRGYGYGLEGKNPTTPTNKIFAPVIDYKVNRSGKFVLPILIEEAI